MPNVYTTVTLYPSDHEMVRWKKKLIFNIRACIATKFKYVSRENTIYIYIYMCHKKKTYKESNYCCVLLSSGGVGQP